MIDLNSLLVCMSLALLSSCIRSFAVLELLLSLKQPAADNGCGNEFPCGLAASIDLVSDEGFVSVWKLFVFDAELAS